MNTNNDSPGPFFVLADLAGFPAVARDVSVARNVAEDGTSSGPLAPLIERL
jgi:hypothetical protein